MASSTNDMRPPSERMQHLASQVSLMACGFVARSAHQHCAIVSIFCTPAEGLHDGDLMTTPKRKTMRTPSGTGHTPYECRVDPCLLLSIHWSAHPRRDCLRCGRDRLEWGSRLRCRCGRDRLGWGSHLRCRCGMDRLGWKAACGVTVCRGGCQWQSGRWHHWNLICGPENAAEPSFGLITINAQYVP